jgi:hypothetical protein
VKIVVRRTHANERSVKNWFLAKNGPTGRHLVDLMRTSDQVLDAVLLMSGRQELVIAKKLADSKRVLMTMLDLIGELQGRPVLDPRDVIYAAIHSAFAKYPKDDSSASNNRWIAPAQSAHLTMAIILELNANGFQIVKKVA